MAELVGADVATFTNDRLEDDDNTRRMLSVALRVARRAAGWHVSPVKSGHMVIIDGPDSRILNLPTRKLNTLTSITEDGSAVDLSTLLWSAGGLPEENQRPVSVRKKTGGWWSADYRAIQVVMTHGYTEDEAADWRQAILTMVDQMSLVPIGGMGISDAALRTKKVDDVTYGWDNAYVLTAQDALFSVEHILCDYRLPAVEFV